MGPRDILPSDIVAFVRRDFAGVAEAKQRYWTEQYEASGAAAALRAAQQLFDHAQRVRAPFPSACESAADLAFHVAFKEKLDRASRALSIRRGFPVT